MSWEAWGTPEYMELGNCRDCEGCGALYDDEGNESPCPNCNGTGFVDDSCEDDVI